MVKLNEPRRVAERFARSARSHGEAALVAAGVRHYRPRYDLTPSSWDSDYASGSLDHYGARHERARYAVLTAFLELLAPRSILDLGCGVGLLRGHIEHLGFERYVGIDPSAVAIGAAVECGFSRSNFAVGTEPRDSFDAIVCNEMLYYVEDLDALLGSIRANLTPHGRLIVSIYKHPGDFALHREIAKRFSAVDGVDLRDLLSRHRWKLASYQAR